MKIAPGSVCELWISRYIVVAINLTLGPPVAINQVMIYCDVLRRNAWIDSHLKVEVLATDIIPDDDSLCLWIIKRDPSTP